MAIIKNSTRAMLRKHGWRFDRFIHNYFYFLYYEPYVKAAFKILDLVKQLTWFKPLGSIAKAIFDRYHSKVIGVEDTKKIFTINEDIIATSEKNKQIVPYKYAYKIILKEARFIAVMDCPCKKATNAPEDTLSSCIAVGKDLATFWLDHCGEKYNARKISQQEALDIIRRLRKSGHITNAFFKVATGGSTGVICNCHPDTCVSLAATKLTKKIDPAVRMNVSSGYSVQRSETRCTRCGTCEKTCHFNAILSSENEYAYNPENCMGCELCVENCPNGALALYNDTAKSLPLDLDIIKEEFLDKPQPSAEEHS